MVQQLKFSVWTAAISSSASIGQPIAFNSPASIPIIAALFRFLSEVIWQSVPEAWRRPYSARVAEVRTMCGRYAVTSAPEAIRALFGYPEQPNFPPRYNVAPTQPIAIVRLIEGKRQFALVRWGLLPSWVKDPKSFSLLINARGELVSDKPAFGAAMKYRRCLVPADGFYEWKATGPRKQPYYVRARSGQPLAFAGLLGELDRTQRRGNGNGRHRDDTCQS